MLRTSKAVTANHFSVIPISLLAVWLGLLPTGRTGPRATPNAASPDFASPTPETGRPSFRELATPALSAIDGAPDVFGGAYVDESTGLHVLYVGDVSEARARLERLLPVDLPVTFRRVAWSQARLSEIKAAIIELWQKIGMDRISEVSVNLLTNRVVVGLPASDPAFEAQLRTSNGTAVAFEITPPDEYAPR